MKILVVEDDNDSRTMLTALLGGNGHSVEEASDGEEAWKILEESPPDLIVTDILMPKMDGFSLCRKVKNDLALEKIPVIFYTATYVSKEDEELALSLGGTLFIVKPEEPDVLLQKIQTVLKLKDHEVVSLPNKTADVLDEMHLRALSDKLHQKVMVLEKTNQALHETNEELRDFVHIVSHDFQEPLRKISIFSDRLDGKSQESTEKGAFYLERLQHSVKRMQDLMNDLVKYSKIVPSKTKSIQSVNLEGIIQKVLIDLEILLNETEGKVELEPLSTIQADPFQMRGLFQNLIANSLKYHKKGVPPLIKIKGQTSPSQSGFYEIRVEDNGIGFDEKYTSRIFRPFERLHRESEYKGTGMGLTLCKKIVERHGGSIDVNSKVNEGTTFIINLPLKQA
jgi:signal transduction histidine kinase